MSAIRPPTPASSSAFSTASATAPDPAARSATPSSPPSPPSTTPCSSDYPFTTLDAGGLAVGLPEGQMGNSEVGHLTIGAGRVVNQELVRIGKSLARRRFRHAPGLARVHRHGPWTAPAACTCWAWSPPAASIRTPTTCTASSPRPRTPA